MIGRRGWQIAFGLLLVVQFWALYAPKVPSVDSGLPLDKAVHFALFATVTWLGLRAGIPAGWVAWLMVLQAALSEVVQNYLLPQRGGDIWDFAADLAGIGVGLWLGRSRARAVAD
jgi:VanZ family protein